MNHAKLKNCRAVVGCLGIVLAILICVEFAFDQDLKRGLQNYRAIMSGQKKFEQLSPDERKEVLIILRAMQSRTRSEGKSPECRDALDRAESAASDLEHYTKRLGTCAANRDFDDDCSTEYRRVRNAHSDYESAVSDVQSYCR
jgi:hypothetical protein